MRTFGCCLALMVLSSPAMGSPWNLEGGAFIAHHVPEVGFSVDPPAGGWCAAYPPYAIASCEEQNNRIDVTGSLGVTWYVLAAWYLNDKVYCGVEFGLGSYDARVFEFVEYGPCFPEGGYELPTAGWPGPNEGIAITVGTGHWSGNFQAVYYFGGYAYSSYGAEIIPLGVNPATGHAGSANCAFPVEGWDAAELGGIGINTDGIHACPPIPAIRVCCDEAECFLVSMQECLDMDGEWYPEYDSCEMDNPCPVEEAVCCLGGACHLLLMPDCNLVGGEWHPEWQSCEPNPCSPSPVNEASWGAIKSRFR